MFNPAETTDIYRQAYNYAKGLSSDVHLFTGAMFHMMDARIWESGWIDPVHGTLVCAPTLKDFIERPAPKGIGQTIPWTYAALKTAGELGEKRGPEALELLDKQIKLETNQTAEAIYKEMVKAAVPEQAKPAKGGRGIKTKTNGPGFSSGSNRAASTLARLKRDHPALAERVVTGKLSANAAAIEAGIREKVTPLVALRRAWKRASAEERDAFLAEINAAPR